MRKWLMSLLGSGALLGAILSLLAQVWVVSTPSPQPTWQEQIITTLPCLSLGWRPTWREQMLTTLPCLLMGWHPTWEPVRHPRPHRNPNRRRRLSKKARLRLLRRLGLRPRHRHVGIVLQPVTPLPSPADTPAPGGPALRATLPVDVEPLPSPADTPAPGGPAPRATLPVDVEPLPPQRRRGRPATIPTNHVFCPQKTCRGFGQLGPHPDHRIVGYGTYTTRSGQRQLYRCQWCHTVFSETQGTVFYGLKTPEETVYRALAALAEGLGIRATARVFGVKPADILRWLRRAGQHCEQVSAYLMRNLHVEQAQMDELWTFVRKKEKALSAWEQLHTDWGDTWVWTVFDPVSKLVLAFYVGERDAAEAVGVLGRLKAVLVEGCVPLFTSDQLPHYLRAILQVFGRRVQPARQGRRGCFPKPRWEPTENLHYATVHKERENNRVVAVTTQVVFGPPEALWARLKALGVKQINTAFVERMNLTLRHLVSRLKRRGLNFSKRREDLVWHLHLSVAYYHFVRTHRSLRQRLAQPVPTRGTPKQWEQRTPAMAAGLTDHIWDMGELLRFRVPAVAA